MPERFKVVFTMQGAIQVLGGVPSLFGVARYCFLATIIENKND